MPMRSFCGLTIWGGFLRQNYFAQIIPQEKIPGGRAILFLKIPGPQPSLPNYHLRFGVLGVFLVSSHTSSRLVFGSLGSESHIMTWCLSDVRFRYRAAETQLMFREA